MADASHILVTGPTGQLGSELCSALAPLGKVVAPRRDRMDLADPGRIRAFILDCQPDLIVSAAAYTAVDRAETEPDLARAVNAEAPGVMAECAATLGCPIIHFSTDYVFDGRAAEPYPPDAPTCPINMYGTTKRDGELAIIASGADHLIIRTAWVYAMTGRNFVRAILTRAAQGEPLRVVNDQHGSPTWAHDLAAGATAIASQLLQASDRRTGIYHLTGDGITTWYDFASAIIEHANLAHQTSITPVPTSEFPTRAKRPAYTALDCTTTERDFSIKLPHWREAIKRALNSRGRRNEGATGYPEG